MSDSDSDSTSTSSNSSSSYSSSSNSSHSSPIPRPVTKSLNIPEHQRLALEEAEKNAKSVKVKSETSATTEGEGEGEVDDSNRGPPLAVETLNYFRQIHSTLLNFKENVGLNDEISEEEEILVNNVYSELNSNIEYRLLVNKHGSQCMRLIIEKSNSQQIIDFLGKLIENEIIIDLIHDRQASHVIQKIIHKIPNILMEEYSNKSIDTAESSMNKQFNALLTLFNSPYGEFESVWQSMLHNEFASFILRDILAVLSGTITFKSDLSVKTHDPPVKATDLAYLSNFSTVLPNFANSLLELSYSSLNALIYQSTASPSIQSLLQCLFDNNNQELLVKLIEKILYLNQIKEEKQIKVKKEESDSDSNSNSDDEDSDNEKDSKTEEEEPVNSESHIQQLLFDRIASHLVEKIIELSPDSIHIQLFELIFKSHLLTYCQHSLANYTIQKLFIASNNANLIESCFNELNQDFKVLIDTNRAGVLWRLIESAAKNRLKLKPIVIALAKAVEIENIEDNSDFSLIEKYLSLKTNNNNTTNNESNDDLDNPNTQPTKSSTIPAYRPFSRFSYFGCLIIQKLFEFIYTKDCYKYITSCLFELKTPKLIELACDSIGSRLLDSFLNSNFKLNLKHKLCDLYRGNYIQLAINKYGSFVIEKLFNLSNIDHKVEIMKELIENEPLLINSKSGKTIQYKFNLNLFKKAEQTWKGKQMEIMNEIKNKNGRNKKKEKKEKENESKEELQTKKGENKSEKKQKFNSYSHYNNNHNNNNNNNNNRNNSSSSGKYSQSSSSRDQSHYKPSKSSNPHSTAELFADIVEFTKQNSKKPSHSMDSNKKRKNEESESKMKSEEKSTSRDSKKVRN